MSELVLSLRSGREQSTIFVFYAVFFLLLAITSWGLLGYTDISAIVSVWALIIISFAFLVYAVSDVPRSRLFEKLPYVCLILSIWLLILISKIFYPHGLQDEITIDTYSAYLFLHHVDPYVPANMVNVFSFYHFPISMTTPTTLGGYVDYLIYPALSVYAFIPSVVFGIPNYWIPIIFNIVTFFVLMSYFRKRGLADSIPVLAVLVFVEAELFAGAIGGETDIIWVFFLVLAYIYRDRPWVAGLFFGLSLAQKQIPVVVAPFFLYLLYRENGRRFSSVFTSVSAAAGTFLVANLPFIIMGPGAWVSGMLLSVEQPAIGVGFGFGVLSFAGYAPIPSAIFSDLLITSLALFFVIYVRYFDSLKYAFFAFPIIIFLFNFRSLENYVIYWPLLVLLVLPDYLKDRSEREKEEGGSPYMNKPLRRPFFTGGTGLLKKSNFTIFLMMVVVVGGGLSTGYTLHDDHVYAHQLKINEVYNYSNPVGVDSSITAMTVNISYSPLVLSKARIPVYFRIIPQGPVSSNINDLLWSAGNPYISPGNNTLTIFPNLYSDFLNVNTSFTMEAYYGNITAFYHSTSPASISSGPIQDPYLLFPTYNKAKPFPGWNTTYSGKHGNISYDPGGIAMNISVPAQFRSSWNSMSISSPFDFSYLAQNNYTLSYEIRSTKGTSMGANNTISGFSGVRISFNGGQETLWLGYNATSSSPGYYENSRVNQTIVSASTSINFSSLAGYLTSRGWGFGDAHISYVIVGHPGTRSSMHVDNITVKKNGTTVPPLSSNVSLENPYALEANVYLRSNFSLPVMEGRPFEVVSW